MLSESQACYKSEESVKNVYRITCYTLTSSSLFELKTGMWTTNVLQIMTG